MSRAVPILIAVSIFYAPALADDLTPPPWRFSPGSTVQHWDFSAGPVGGPPDALPLNNPYGTPMFTPLGSASWVAAALGRNDIWDLSAGGGLDFRVPNTGNAANQKILWLQVTYFSVASLPPPVYSVFAPTSGFSLISSQVTPLSNGWYHELTQWHAPICPPLEIVQIFPGLMGTITLIDQVVIDTQCIPAPGAASTLAFAGVLAFRRRRSA